VNSSVQFVGETGADLGGKLINQRRPAGTQEDPSMWKQLWRTWTIDKPAAFGDLLWDVLVVRFAAFLDRLTVRRVIAFIPVLILGVAYAHSIPLPPELLLVGDLLAYIDIFSVLVLLGIMSRVTTVLFILKQAAAYAATWALVLRNGAKRLDLRHRREGGARSRKRAIGWARKDDDEPVVTHGLAWA